MTARLPALDRAEAERFLEALGCAGHAVVFQTFDDAKQGRKRLTAVMVNTLAGCWKRLEGLNRGGAGVFLQVNAGAGGRGKNRITGLRSLFVDDDTNELDLAAVGLDPSIVVRSKAGLHLYWRLRPREQPDAFTPAQLALAAHYGTDRKVKNLDRVMRLPGTLHMKDPNDPFPVRVVQTKPVSYSIAEVLESVGATLAATPVPAPGATSATKPNGAPSVTHTPPQRASADVRKRAAALCAAAAPVPHGQGYDNACLGLAGKLVRGFGLSDADALPLLRVWGDRQDPPVPETAWIGKYIPNAHKYLSEPYGGLLDARRPAKLDAPRTTTVGAPGEHPAIHIGPDAERVVGEALVALSVVPGIYQRAGMLVQVVREAAAPKGVRRPVGAPRIGEVREARLLELLAAAATWLEIKKKGTRHVLPPGWAVRAALARGEWAGISKLMGVIESPVLRADGSVLSSPGYDAASGLFYAPPHGLDLDIAEAPSQADAVQAVEQLFEVVQDFPFATATDRAAWLAGVLTPLCRYAMDGPAPLLLIDGNIRGCGKSLLADVTGIIVADRDMTRMAPPEKDEEMRKRITALALAGDQLVLIDNVTSFGWPSLDAALTAQAWDDRILGQSRSTGRLDLTASWYATGNNVILEADTVRRVLHVRLETGEENPEERESFHHADLRAWTRQNRPRLLSAALTILRAYVAAGCPRQAVPAWGSFEAWTALVRGALVWSGAGDPAANRREFMGQADRERAILGAILRGLEALDPHRRGFTTADVLRHLAEPATITEPDAIKALRWAVVELAGDPPRGRTLGKRFQHLQRRVVGGRCLARDGLIGAGVRWRVAVPGHGYGGGNGDVEPHSHEQEIRDLPNRDTHGSGTALTTSTTTTMSTGTGRA